jgi:DNA polymerase elongation subunit (family B)
MLNNVKIENILFLDIETVACVSEFNKLDSRFKDLWAKKMHYYIEKDNKTPEQLFSKAAIWAEFGKIVCISVGYLVGKKQRKLRIKSFYGHNEKQLLIDFALLLSKYFNKDNNLLCAHNGKEFDFPYIARRMLVNGLELPRILRMSGKKPWEVKHLDTLELWKFGDYKHYTSLDLLAALFNIPSPKEQIDGSMVNDVYWKDDNLKKIVEYCQKDVVTVCNVFLKFNNKDIVDNESIDIVESKLSE